MYTYTNLELLSCKECMKVASIDAPKMSTDSRKYIESNTLSYYVAINSWLLMIKQFSGYYWTHFAKRLMRDGLIDTIDYCQKQSMAFIRHEQNDKFTEVFYASIECGKNSALFEDRNIDKSKAATFLFLMRYLKRFSPNNNDIIQTQSMIDFMSNENRLKQLSRKEFSPFVVNLVKDEITHMYPWKRIVKKIKALSIDDLEFSSGVCRGTGADLASKCLYLAHSAYSDSFFPTPFGTRLVSSLSVYSDEYIHEFQKAVKPQAVPKSYKRSRIIAPENVYRQGMGKAIERIFREEDRLSAAAASRFKPSINLEDQTINQRLAKAGSEDGYWATLDASNASDLISKTLFRAVFPADFIEAIEPYLDDYIEYEGGNMKPMQMMSTAGHSLTFRLETIVYLAIVRAATHLCIRMRGQKEKVIPDCWAYGDDTLLPSFAAETAIDFFSSLGLVINVDKSYFSPDLLYRESCGEEYYKGEECTSLYFPRFPLKGLISDSGVVLDSYTFHDGREETYESSITMLISLQKKIYPYSKDAAYFLLEIMQAADKRLTTSMPYDDTSSDPWGLLDTGKPVSHPSYEIVECSYSELESQQYCCAFIPRVARFCPTLPKVRIIRKKTSEPTFSNIGAYDEFQKFSDLDRYHSCPKVEALGKGEDGRDDPIYQAFKYREFLIHGPKYNSPLDELLGVSSPSLSYAEFCGKRQIKLKFIVK